MSKILSYQPILSVSVRSTTDIPKCRFVEYSGRLCRLGMKSLGISEIDTISGEMIPVIALGTMTVLANDEINVGDELTSDDEGRAMVLDTGYSLNGWAMTNAVAGEYVKVMLR